MSNFFIFIVISAIILPSVVFPIRRLNRSCKAPLVCVNIYECPFYVDLQTKQPHRSSTIQSIRKNFCGLLNEHTPKVCCEANTLSSGNNVLSHRNLQLLPLEACGPVSHQKRITEGVGTAAGEFPWMALLAYKRESPHDEEFKCGGTLINDRYVLTAAHCVADDQILVSGVRLGEHDILAEMDCDKNGNNCEEPVQDIKIEKVIIHPGYNPVSFINDIALIHLASAANTSADNVKPVCLPLVRRWFELNLSGRFLMVTGWGVTDTGLKSNVLQKTSVPVVSLRSCSTLFSRFKPITGKQLCAGGYKGRDSCAGDSGGPLQTVVVAENEARYVQYGIVSYGPAMCGMDGRPAIYTNVREYLSWILDNIS